MTSQPQTIQIFLPGGNPQGLRQAEITTRTVQVFDVPRSVLGEFLGLEQSHQVGLYFLFGSASAPEDRIDCYVGESDDVGHRLKSHDRNKLFWDRALVAVSLTNSWTKAHVRYLEAKAVKAGREAGRYTLTNGNEGFTTAYTPRPLQADCDEFFETVSVLTATLGFPVLRPMQTRQRTEPARVLHMRGLTETTSGTYSADGLTVFAGTVLVNREPGSRTYERIEAQRAALEADGVLGREGDRLAFLRDYVFASPSGAACLIRGRTANGWDNWRDAANRSLDQIERVAVEQGTSTSTTPEEDL